MVVLLLPVYPYSPQQKHALLLFQWRVLKTTVLHCFRKWSLSFVLFVIHFLKSYIFSEGTGLVPEKCVERCTNTLLVGLTRRVS